MLKDASRRAEIGAAYYVASLREAVEACLQAARERAAARAEDGTRPERTAAPAASLAG